MDVKKQKTNRTYALLAGVIIAVVAGVAACLIRYLAVSNEILPSLGVGFTAFFFALAVYYAVVGVLLKRRSSVALAVFAAVLGVILLLVVLSVKWFVVLIIAFAAIAVALFGVLMLYGGKTALVFDNEKEDFKDYKTRAAEKAKNEAEQPEEELPEIKSFK